MIDTPTTCPKCGSELIVQDRITRDEFSCSRSICSYRSTFLKEPDLVGFRRTQQRVVQFRQERGRPVVVPDEEVDPVRNGKARKKAAKPK